MIVRIDRKCNIVFFPLVGEQEGQCSLQEMGLDSLDLEDLYSKRIPLMRPALGQAMFKLANFVKLFKVIGVFQQSNQIVFKIHDIKTFQKLSLSLNDIKKIELFGNFILHILSIHYQFGHCQTKLEKILTLTFFLCLLL